MNVCSPSVIWRGLHAALPPDQVGRCVLTPEGRLYASDPAGIPPDLGCAAIRFHRGRIGGALPVIVGLTARDTP